MGYGGTAQGAINYLSGQTIQIVQIVIEPWFMGELVERNPMNLPRPLREILQGDLSQAYVHMGETNPTMQMALSALRSLNSKILKMLASETLKMQPAIPLTFLSLMVLAAAISITTAFVALATITF